MTNTENQRFLIFSKLEGYGVERLDILPLLLSRKGCPNEHLILSFMYISQVSSRTTYYLRHLHKQQ